MSHKTPEYKNPNVKILSSFEDDEDTEKLGESDFFTSIISMVTDSGDKSISKSPAKKMLHPSLRILEMGGGGIISTETQENVFKPKEIDTPIYTLLRYLSVYIYINIHTTCLFVS